MIEFLFRSTEISKLVPNRSIHIDLVSSFGISLSIEAMSFSDYTRMIPLCFLVLVAIAPSSCQTIEDTQRLMDHLLTGYNRDIRPVLDQSKPVVVNISFSLVAIQEFDEVSETFVTIGILNFDWFDPRMTWDPALYNNTYAVFMRIPNVWTPDLILSSPVDSIRVLGDRQEWMTVCYYYDGHAYWSPGDVFKSACSVNVTYYPFDVQSCEMMFIPWGLSLKQIYLQSTHSEVFLDYFKENGEWTLTKSRTYADDKADYDDRYTVEITVTRRPTYFLVNVVLPMLFMAFLNVLVFWLPAESGERISYAITVLLAISVFLTIVGDNMPKTSKTMSILCYFLVTNLFMSALICATAIFNLTIYFGHWDRPVPKWLDVITRLFHRKKGAKTTPVQECVVTQLDDENDAEENDKKDPHNVEKWAEAVGEDPGSVQVSRDQVPVNWRQVSCAIDKVFGTVAFLWLVLSSTIFIIMVACHTLST